MERILACVDFSSVTTPVLASVRSLAKETGAAVTLLHVAAPDPDFVGYEAGPQSVRDGVAAELRDTHRTLQDHADALRADGFEVTPLTVQGYVVERVLDHADRLGADIIVLGSHGHGVVFELLVGSVARGVLKAAKVPVLVVPPPERTAPASD